MFPCRLILAMTLSSLLFVAESVASEATRPSFVSNDAVITGFYSDLDLEDTESVFYHVLSQLDDEVTVYPSEGYYYFRFPMRGLTVRGAITLYAFERDQGIVGFGYVGEIEDRPEGTYTEMPGRSHRFSVEDGLIVRELDELSYEVEYEDRKVTFHLYDPGWSPPAPPHLAAGETYVGSNFDESGLRFHLLFSEPEQRLYWMLDESRFLPEALTVFDENVVVGARTGFAFFCDTERDRKILVGVRAAEVSYNTWYDGPFDQLPDAYIANGTIDMRQYIVAHTGISADTIDRYGNIKSVPGARIPVAPYRMYSSLDELRFVSDLVAEQEEAGSSRGPAETRLIVALTREGGREWLEGAQMAEK